MAVLLVAALATACAGGSVESDDDASELGRAALVPTRSVSAKADPALVAIVQSMESAGAEGGWFQSTFPVEGAKRTFFYALQKAPSRPDPQSAMLLLRLEHSRAAVEAALSAGTPLVIGRMPAEYQAAAATFSGDAVAVDALAALGSSKKAIVFLPPETLRTTLAHELQHWRDFEDAAYERRYAELAKPFTSARYLSDDDKFDLERIVIELRGHGMGEKQAREDLAKGRPTFLRGGVPVPQDQLASAYDGDIANQVNVFLSVYRPALRAIEAKVKSGAPADHAKLATLIDELNIAPEGSRLRGLVKRD